MIRSTSSSCVRFTSADSATRIPWTSGPPDWYRPGLRNGQDILDASAFSGRNSSWVTVPLGQRRRETGRTGSQTSR